MHPESQQTGADALSEAHGASVEGGGSQKESTSTATELELKLRYDLRDGFEVHRAALARGLDVRLLPRQVMEVSLPGDETASAAFTHGVPQATTLAGATFAQDRRIRRAILRRAGLAVPRGATFSVGRSKGAARRFAARVGYPVVVKPEVGDNTVEVSAGLKNERQFNKAIKHLTTPPEQRKGFTRAAYALTELREPGRQNGKLVAPPGYRFLVEKHLSGEYLRFLVIGGEARGVILCPDGPWRSRGATLRDVQESTHPSLKAIAVAAAQAMPGLSLAAVDMVVADHTRETSVEAAPIVEVSERPWLSIVRRQQRDSVAPLAAEILACGLPEGALRAPQAEVAAEVRIGGAVDPTGLLAVLEQRFEELGVTGDLHETDHALGEIGGSVRGMPERIAWVAERLLDRGIQGQRAMVVEQRVS
ncbi:hypothetical protein [Nesterenkonia suensis]